MRDDYTLLTPENVELRYEVAGVGSRLYAAMLDYAILSFGYLALLFGGAFAVAALRDLWRSSGIDQRLVSDFMPYGTLALVVLLAFFGWWGYFVLFEALWNGQSPGKRMLGLRVVRAVGQPIGVGPSLVRNVLRAVDLFLFIGVLVMLLDRSSRRLGDLAAGSLVVREPGGFGRGALVSVDIPDVPAAQVEALPNAARLTMAHYTLVRDYFARRHKLRPAQDAALAARLVADLAGLLEVDPSHIGDPATFLATTARSFEARHRYDEGSGPL